MTYSIDSNYTRFMVWAAAFALLPALAGCGIFGPDGEAFIRLSLIDKTGNELGREEVTISFDDGREVRTLKGTEIMGGFSERTFEVTPGSTVDVSVEIAPGGTVAGEAHLSQRVKSGKIWLVTVGVPGEGDESFEFCFCGGIPMEFSMDSPELSRDIFWIWTSISNVGGDDKIF